MLIEEIYDKITGGNNQGFQDICQMVQINPEYKLIRNKLIGEKSLRFWCTVECAHLLCSPYS